MPKTKVSYRSSSPRPALTHTVDWAFPFLFHHGSITRRTMRAILKSPMSHVMQVV